MNNSPKTGRVIGLNFKKRPAKKRLLSKDNFSMYAIWIKDFFMIHHTIYQYIGDSLENFYNILDDRFFMWLNQPKNNSKFMFEIKREFMDMADDILIREIMVKKLKNPILLDLNENLEERHIPQANIAESESDYEIDYFSDPEPCYDLMEERHIPDEVISEIEISTYDENYYSSFFL
jgi:hypothetical protein